MHNFTRPAKAPTDKPASAAGRWVRRASVGLCLALVLAACTSDPEPEAAIDTTSTTTTTTAAPTGDGNSAIDLQNVDPDDIAAALARSARDDVAIALPEAAIDAAVGDTVPISATVFGVLGEAGDGVVIRPQINFSAAPGLTPTDLPSECDGLADGAVECIFDSTEKWFLGSTGDPTRTETQTWTVGYTVDSSASGTIEIEAVATSTDNPVDNDPDSSNNSGIIAVQVG